MRLYVSHLLGKEEAAHEFPVWELLVFVYLLLWTFGHHRNFNPCFFEWHVIPLGMVRKSSNTWGLRGRDRREGRHSSQNKGIGRGTLGCSRGLKEVMSPSPGSGARTQRRRTSGFSWTQLGRGNWAWGGD